MAIPTGRTFAKALEEAGVITDINRVERIIIDVADAMAPVRIYVQYIGDKKMLDVAGVLGTMIAEAAPEPEYVPEHAAGCALMLPHAAGDCRPAEGGGA